MVLETFSNCVTPGNVTLVANVIVNKKEIKKIKLFPNFPITNIRNVTIYYLLKKNVFNFHFNFVTLGINTLTMQK